ncbi:MAG: acetylglutamate kinase [Clostridia bacterium]|nr:acetylglutamate kinase [Clostridia bacterium]
MNTNYDDIINKANILVEALPYIRAFYGKFVVVKYGGNAMNDPEIIKTILQDVAVLKMVGVYPIVVHGGGPEINAMLARVGVKSEFINGLRVTDAETMEIVQMILCGKVNKNVTSKLGSMGVKAVGLSGKDNELIKVRKKAPVNGVDYGYVGEIVSVDGEMLKTLCREDYIPVIATIGVDENGDSYNINADTAACEIGASVGADKLLFLTDIDGIRRDASDEDTLIPDVSVADAEKLIEDGVISGGMIPKVRGCITAVEKGIKHVHIINGTIPHCILVELFTHKGIGTLIHE